MDRRVAHLRFLAIAVVSIVAALMTGCSRLRCQWYGNTCLDVTAEPLDQRAPLAHVSVAVDEIAPDGGPRRPMASAEDACSGATCRILLPYRSALASSQNRYVLSVQASGPDGKKLVANDVFVLTYGGPAVRVHVVLFPEDLIFRRHILEYVAKWEDDASGRLSSTGGFLAPDSFFEARFLDAQLVRLMESRKVQGRVQFFNYFCEQGRLVAVFVGASPDPRAAQVRLIYGPGSQVQSLTDGPENGESAEQLAMHFLRIREEASTRAKAVAKPTPKRVGWYKFGSGANTVFDCSTKSFWWVTGEPSLVSSLADEYLATAGDHRPSLLLMEYAGELHPHLSGKDPPDVEISSYRFVDQAAAPTGCEHVD